MSLTPPVSPPGDLRPRVVLFEGDCFGEGVLLQGLGDEDEDEDDEAAGGGKLDGGAELAILCERVTGGILPIRPRGRPRQGAPRRRITKNLS